MISLGVDCARAVPGVSTVAIYSIMGVLFHYWGSSYVLNGHYTAAHKAQLGWFSARRRLLSKSRGMAPTGSRPVVDQAGIRGLRFRRGGAATTYGFGLNISQFAGEL